MMLKQKLLHRVLLTASILAFQVLKFRGFPKIASNQGRSQDFSKGGAEVMEAKALKRKNCL